MVLFLQKASNNRVMGLDLELAHRVSVWTILRCAISRVLIVLEPSYSEYGCILGSSQMSSELNDLDLFFQGHFVPDVC